MPTSGMRTGGIVTQNPVRKNPRTLLTDIETPSFVCTPGNNFLIPERAITNPGQFSLHHQTLCKRPFPGRGVLAAMVSFAELLKHIPT